MTRDEVNFVEDLLKSPIKRLRKLANDINKECSRIELIVMVIENELFENLDIDDSFRGGVDESGNFVIYPAHREVCSNMIGTTPIPDSAVEHKQENPHL